MARGFRRGDHSSNAGWDARQVAGSLYTPIPGARRPKRPSRAEVRAVPVAARGRDAALKVESRRILKAGNEHTLRPVIVLTLADTAALTVPAQAARELGATLPPLRADVTDFPGWSQLTAAEDPVPVAAIVEVFAVAVQRYVFWPVRFCGWRPVPQGSQRQDAAGRAVFEIGTRRSGLAAAKAAVALATALVEGKGLQEIRAAFAREMKAFLKATLDETPDTDSLGIADAAASQGISWSVLPNTQFLRLGSGRFAHYLHVTLTTKTPVISHRLSISKRLTTFLLSAAGLPVPAQRTLRKEEDAVAAAQAIGFPVVVKPEAGSLGRGVSVGICDEAGLVAAVRRAQAISPKVVLEAFIPGKEYRLLVVDGRFVAAANRRPAQVQGDGSATVQELIRRVNARPEREAALLGRRAVRRPLVLDEDALEFLSEQGLSPDSVPAEGRTVLLRRQSNISQGGDSVDVTDEVHPSVREMAERAAALLRIDVCGVDFLTTDISRPPEETGGAICELNTEPGLSAHKFPSEGSIQNVSAAIVDLLFPGESPGRCPVIVLLEPDEEARNLRRSIEAVAARRGRCLGVVLGSDRTSVEDPAPLPTSLYLKDVEALDWEVRIDGALVEVSAAEITRRGLGLDRVDLALVPSSGSGATLARAGRALARLAGNGVVPSDDPKALQMALEVLNLPAPPNEGP